MLFKDWFNYKIPGATNTLLVSKIYDLWQAKYNTVLPVTEQDIIDFVDYIETKVHRIMFLNIFDSDDLDPSDLSSEVNYQLLSCFIHNLLPLYKSFTFAKSMLDWKRGMDISTDAYNPIDNPTVENSGASYALDRAIAKNYNETNINTQQLELLKLSDNVYAGLMSELLQYLQYIKVV